MMLKINGFSLLAEYQTTSSIVPDDITQRVRNNGTVSSSFFSEWRGKCEKLY